MSRAGWLVVCLVACGSPKTEPPAPDASIIGQPGTYMVAGTVRYEDRAPVVLGPKAGLAAVAPKVARGVTVSVIADDTSMPLATATTNDDGTYALSFDAVGGQNVHILAATTSTSPMRPLTVRKRAGIHGFGGATFQAGLVTNQDLLATIASNTAEAFNVFDVCLDALDHVRTKLGHATPVPLVAIWEVGSNDGTYYSNHTLHLLGAASDDDGFDDTVILHESGHYIEDVEGRSDSPGGSHDGRPTDPRLAWSEGWATYWAMTVRGESTYLDTNAGGGFSYNADAEVLKANPAGGINQQVGEDMVSQILWDLGDAGTPDDDGYAGSHDINVNVEPGYLATATLRNVGVQGVDLVDFLDGWFVKAGLASCTAAKAIVTTTHGFPYDYAGPAGSCP